MDHFSKSDPAVYLYTSGRELNWVPAGRTEVIDNNLNPKVYARKTREVAGTLNIVLTGSGRATHRDQAHIHYPHIHLYEG